MKIATVLVFLSSFIVGGCILPVPVYYMHGPEVTNTVIDDRTGQPIEGAHILIRSFAENCADRTATTAANGSFRVPESGDIHFGFWIAPPTAGTLIPCDLLSDGVGINRHWYYVSIEKIGYKWGIFRVPGRADSEVVYTPPLPTDGIYRLRPLSDTERVLDDGMSR